MNYIRLLISLSVTWVLMILIFSFSVGPGESFHLAHYFWLLVAAGIVVLVERKKYEKGRLSATRLDNSFRRKEL